MKSLLALIFFQTSPERVWSLQLDTSILPRVRHAIEQRSRWMRRPSQWDFNQKHRLLFIDLCTHMNRWEHIYKDVNNQYLQHEGKERARRHPLSLYLSPARRHTDPHTPAGTNTHTHTHAHARTHTHTLYSIKWTVWKHKAQQASLVSYFRQGFQSVKAYHKSPFREYWQSSRPTSKPTSAVAHFTSLSVYFDMPVEQWHIFLLGFFWSPAEDEWLMLCNGVKTHIITSISASSSPKCAMLFVIK